MTDLYVFEESGSHYWTFQGADAITQQAMASPVKAVRKKLTDDAVKKSAAPAYDTHLGKVYLPRAQGGLVECDLAKGTSHPFRTEIQYSCVSYVSETQVLYAGLSSGGTVHSFRAEGGSRGTVAPTPHVIADASQQSGPDGEFFGMAALHDSQTNATYLYLTQGKQATRLITHIVDPSKIGGTKIHDDLLSRDHGAVSLGFAGPRKMQVSVDGKFLVVGFGSDLAKVWLDQTPPKVQHLYNEFKEHYELQPEGSSWWYGIRAFGDEWVVVGKDICIQTRGTIAGDCLYIGVFDDSLKLRDARNNKIDFDFLDGGVLSPDGQWAVFSSKCGKCLWAYNPALKQLRKATLEGFALESQNYLSMAWR
ncbi:hypothetical protein [Streptomyces chartreusis]|uniref:hypothetical protein n=1 Tax=Streptomyces chartreusis TaxID=1969 RepID=UPI002E183EFC